MFHMNKVPGGIFETDNDLKHIQDCTRHQKEYMEPKFDRHRHAKVKINSLCYVLIK